MKFATQLCSAIIAITVAASAQAGGHWAQGSSSTATIGAQVLPPITVSGSRTPMLLVPGAFEWLGSNISRISNSDQPLLLNSGIASHTVLNIAGEPDTAFGISLPGESLISIHNGRQALLLNGTLSADMKTGLLDTLGRHRLTINADFSLLDNIKLDGLFSGHFPVTVEHN